MFCLTTLFATQEFLSSFVSGVEPFLLCLFSRCKARVYNAFLLAQRADVLTRGNDIPFLNCEKWFKRRIFSWQKFCFICQKSPTIRWLSRWLRRSEMFDCLSASYFKMYEVFLIENLTKKWLYPENVTKNWLHPHASKAIKM